MKLDTTLPWLSWMPKSNLWTKLTIQRLKKKINPVFSREHFCLQKWLEPQTSSKNDAKATSPKEHVRYQKLSKNHIHKNDKQRNLDSITQDPLHFDIMEDNQKNIFQSESNINTNLKYAQVQNSFSKVHFELFQQNKSYGLYKEEIWKTNQGIQLRNWKENACMSSQYRDQACLLSRYKRHTLVF